MGDCLAIASVQGCRDAVMPSQREEMSLSIFIFAWQAEGQIDNTPQYAKTLVLLTSVILFGMYGDRPAIPGIFQ